MKKQIIYKIADQIIKEAVIKRCPKKDITDSRPESEQQWCLYNKEETRLLGRHPTKQRAKNQEKFVQILKHKKG